MYREKIEIINIDKSKCYDNCLWVMEHNRLLRPIKDEELQKVIFVLNNIKEYTKINNYMYLCQVISLINFIMLSSAIYVIASRILVISSIIVGIAAVLIEKRRKRIERKEKIKIDKFNNNYLFKDNLYLTKDILSKMNWIMGKNINVTDNVYIAKNSDIFEIFKESRLKELECKGMI